jgi:predicted amidohydrolase
LQFNPQVGDVDKNIDRADAVLKKANPKNIDLLVLPELAFTGTFHFISFEASGLLGRSTAIIDEKFRSGRLSTLQT